MAWKLSGRMRILVEGGELIMYYSSFYIRYVIWLRKLWTNLTLDFKKFNEQG